MTPEDLNELHVEQLPPEALRSKKAMTDKPFYLYAVYTLDWVFLGLFPASNSQELINRLPDFYNPLELTWHIYTEWHA